jgi:hypothetical protein
MAGGRAVWAQSEMRQRSSPLPWLFAEWLARGLSDGDLRECITDAWCAVTDNPELKLGHPAWVRMFRATDFVAIPKDLTRPTHALQLFRGATAGRQRGMSWTISETIAGDFAFKYTKELQATTEPALLAYGRGFVYTTIVAKDAVLAHFGHRGEAEYVIDPSMLGEILPVG